jgi:DNA-binding IclR family transcriptional regulator
MIQPRVPKRARPDQALASKVESSKAPAISRAAAVLRLLGKSDVAIGVHTIARELGLVPSTCLHVLRALVAEQLVAFDPDTKRYALDAGVLTLARHWLRRNRFTDVAQPVIDRIGRDHRVTVLGVRIVGIDHMIVVAHSQSGPDFQLRTQIGSRFPALISATGRCVAAFGGHPQAEIEARFATLSWDDPPTLDTWRSQIEQTRHQGFAVDDGNYIGGVTVIAAPVWDVGGRLDHALVAIGIGGGLKRTGPAPLEQDVLASARALSRQLAGSADD